MAMVSSKPAVVTNATLAPFRSSMVLVPTVVPCRISIALSGANPLQSFEHCQRRIGGGRKNLQHLELAVGEIDAIGERPTGIDGYAQIAFLRLDHMCSNSNRNYSREIYQERR